MSRVAALALVLQLEIASFVVAGPFDSHLTEAVPTASITAWANSVVDYSPTSEVNLASFGNSALALGAADGSIVSLGDLADPSGGTEGPGSITVGFQATIVDGPGADFAVFENAFDFSFDPNVSPDIVYAELAFVEVSSNGTDFAQFPSMSLNTEADLHVPFGRDFAGADTTNIHNLAGVNLTNFGTPFDLGELASDPLVLSGAVDLNNIRYVRLIDIPGDGTFTDSASNPILDTWHTVASGGFDLDAVGAINKVPEPASLALACLAAMAWARLNRRDRLYAIGDRTQPSCLG